MRFDIWNHLGGAELTSVTDRQTDREPPLAIARAKNLLALYRTLSWYH